MKSYDERHADIARAWAELRPRVLPSGVVECEQYDNCGWFRVVQSRELAYKACVEVETIRSPIAERFDLWAHLSVSAHKRLPTWDELRHAKELFLGDRRAMQVLPPRAEYVNINPFVLHLYAPLEHDPMPDFRGTNILGVTAI